MPLEVNGLRELMSTAETINTLCFLSGIINLPRSEDCGTSSPKSQTKLATPIQEQMQRRDYFSPALFAVPWL